MIKNFFVPTKKNNYKAYFLRRLAIVSYSLILVFVNSFGGILGISQAQASTITSANIINLTNQERVAWGLNTLQTNSQLSAAALAKANDMFEKQYWDHFGPNGESPWQFIRAAGYNYVYAGENLAKGFRTAEGVHEAWMASPTHKANIISGNYKDIGVAVVEGVLLGKQTILVVQMFGNLTTEVYGATPQQPAEETVLPEQESSPPVAEEKVVVRREAGEIKSIRITSPQHGSVVTNPGQSIGGDTTNVRGKYTVEVYDGENLLGESIAESPDWEFNKDGDWSEGSHTVIANLKGDNIKSNRVDFSVDSKAPTVNKNSIKVGKIDGKYAVVFSIDGEWESLSLVLGSDIINIEYEESEEGILIELNEDQVGDSVIIVLSDEYGNTSELDISEYFLEEESKQKSIFPTIRLNAGDKISIGIVSFIFILLLVEVVVYWKKGRIKDVLNDIFVIGAWWLILTIALFNGFSGIIN